MAGSFLGLEVYTEVAGGSGARVASIEADRLASCVRKTSLAGVEQLSFALSRTHDSIAELLHGRVINEVWSDGVVREEWRLAEDTSQSGRGDRGQVSWTAQALYLDLARAPYFAFDSAGRPTYNFSATQLTATQWLAYAVTACTAAPLPYTVAVGTVDYTNVFGLDGEYATALEIIRAIQQPGRAPGDFYFRRNGATDYKLDLLSSRGSTANTVRVQTARNLLEHVRKRTLINLGTKIVPRGKQGAATRDLSQVIFRVQTVASGTVAYLEDPLGGADPVQFDDQLNGLYCAPVASTFASQQISDSAATDSAITVASTAGWTGGTTLLRFFRTSTSAGERLISLSHPTRVVSPASSGYGPVTRILDMPGAVGDTNLVFTNPWQSTWSNSANPADSWGRDTVTGVTYSRESTIKRNGTYSQKVVASGAKSYTIKVYSPTATPFTTSGLRFTAHAWVYVEAVGSALQRYIRIRVMKPDLSVSYADGDYLDPGEIVGAWVRLSVTNCDLSSASSGVVVAVECMVNNDPNANTSATYYVDSVGLGEADVPIEDVLYSGAIPMWQRANTLLNTISTPIAGYTVTLADLERLDTNTWGDEPLVLGGSLEITDTDLSVTTTQRVVELEQNLLNPAEAAVVLQTPDTTLTQIVAGATGGSTISGAATTPIVTAPALLRTTLAEYGITDGYTKTEIDAKLQALLLNGVPANSYTVAQGLRPALGYGYPGNTWTSRTSGTFGDLKAACYGGGYFLVAGAAGYLATSPTGATWTSQTSGFGATAINGLASSGTVWVAVGDSATLTSASDPTGTWTARTSQFTADHIYGVAYGNGVFVACGANGKISSSTDGTTWTARTSGFGAGDTLYGVSYGNGVFVVAGNGGKITTSPDGTTWTAQTSPATALQQTVAYGNGVFVSAGGSGLLQVSNGTGGAWALYDPGANGSTIYAATYGGDRFVIGTFSGKLFYSLDTIEWVSQSSTFLTSAYPVYALCSNGSTFVAAGGTGTVCTLTLNV